MTLSSLDRRIRRANRADEDAARIRNGSSTWSPSPKWFAAGAGAIAMQLLAGIGVDVGELGSSIADLLGLGGEPDQIETGVRTAIGALAGQYLWPKYMTLSEGVRAIVDRALGR